MTQRISCPHCGKEIKISLPRLEDFRVNLIDVKWGGMDVPEFVKWLQDNLLVDEQGIESQGHYVSHFE